MNFWKEKVRISEGNYKFSLPVISLMHLIGLFPISVYKDKRGYYLQLSSFYSFYCMGLGLFTIIHASVGLYEDLVSTDGISVRIRTRIDALVELFDWGIVYAAAACGFFVVPCKFLTFFKYVETIEDVDRSLKLQHTNWEKYKQAITCYLTFAAMTYQVILDYITYIVLDEEHINLLLIIRRYGCNYFGCVVMMMTEYEFQHLGSNLAKRIKKFNKILEKLDMTDSNLKLTEELFNNSKNLKRFNSILRTKHQIVSKKFKSLSEHWWNVQNKSLLVINAPLNMKLYGERIRELIKVYQKLCDTLMHQNDLLGITGACAITAAFFHLIEASYFMFSDLNENEWLWYVMQSSWLIIHIARFILVVEPYYNCWLEIETTKSIVCKIRCSKIGRYVTSELKTFSLILGLRQSKFSLAGFGEIDRMLLTSIMSYATTYLFILLQYSSEENQ